MDIPIMRNIQIKKGILNIKEKVEVIYEQTITPFGNSAKLGAQKQHIGKRAYVIIIKD